MTDAQTSLPCVSQRWITVILCFLGLISAFVMRICLSLAIIEMTESPAVSTQVTQFSEDVCPGNEAEIAHKNVTIMHGGRFDWSERTQGLILSSFYWGYFFTNIAGGVISDRFGGKHTFGFSVFSTAVLTLVTPFSVEWGGSTALMVNRILMGLGEGPMYPGINVLLARWIPDKERSWAASVAFSGPIVGAVISKAASGAIIRHMNSWPAAFYIFGGFGLICSLLTWVFCYDEPKDSPFISDAEKAYIDENMLHASRNVESTPWRYILRSKPVWALLIMNFGCAYGFLTIITDMPKYMRSVLNYPVDQIGYLLSISPLCASLINYVGSWIANTLIVKGILSTLAVRKIGCTMATTVCGVFVVAISYAGCNGALAVTFYTISMTLHVFTNFSIMVNPLDLAPNYAGTLMGLLSSAFTVGGFISPYVVGELTPNQTVGEWRLVFWIVMMFFVISNAVFLLYGSADVQDWNDPDFLIKKAKRNKKVDNKEAMKLLTAQGV